MADRINISGDAKILVIGHAYIGDLLLDTPAIHCLRKAFPSARIDLLAHQRSRAVVENNPDLSNILKMEMWAQSQTWKRNLSVMREAAKRIAEEKYDLAILFHRSEVPMITLKMAGIPNRIGFINGSRRFLLTAGTKYNLYKHISCNMLKLLKYGLGIKVDYSTPLQLRPDPTVVEAMEARLNKIAPNGIFVGVNPNSNGLLKNWPEENFAFTADGLAELGYIPILIGGPNEKMITEKVRKAMKSEAVDFCGSTSIAELIALISKCKFLVTNDSGPMHIGYALKIPTYAIFGPTDPARCGPWAIESKVFQAKIDCIKCYRKYCWHMTCMREIRPKTVLDTIKIAQK